MAEMFSGMPGRFVELADTIEGFGQLLEGAGDDYPENSFYMVGGLKVAVSMK
jgi:F-type H+-transporting ATPase subunit beta